MITSQQKLSGFSRRKKADLCLLRVLLHHWCGWRAWRARPQSRQTSSLPLSTTVRSGGCETKKPSFYWSRGPLRRETARRVAEAEWPSSLTRKVGRTIRVREPPTWRTRAVGGWVPVIIHAPGLGRRTRGSQRGCIKIVFVKKNLLIEHPP